MSYRIVKNLFGTSKKDTVCEIDIPYKIHDMCFIPKFGFLLALRNNHCISHVDLKGNLTTAWLGDIDKEGYKNCTGSYARLSYPSSICYSSKNNQCFVIERRGASVRVIDLNPAYIATLLGKSDIGRIEKKVSSHSALEVNTCCSSGAYMELYWSISKLNMCYRYCKGKVDVFVGSGKPGYSVCSKIGSSMINNPHGIVCINKDLYISDTDNHCIRKVSKDGISLFEGTPVEKEIVDAPTCLRHHKGVFYFLDGNDVKYYSPSGPSRGVIYSSENNTIKSIELDGRDLLILEKTDA